jgi:hypothetical protein
VGVALLVLAQAASAAPRLKDGSAQISVTCWSVGGTTTTFRDIVSGNSPAKCEWWDWGGKRKKMPKANLADGPCASLIEQRKKAGAVCRADMRMYPVKKPAIYLYPKEPAKIEVRLSFRGAITASYPDYDRAKGGWTVKAYPDGRLIDADGRTYSYLFWEGVSPDRLDHDASQGFVVPAGETRAFLQKTLAELGLKPSEYNDFIVFWLPVLNRNPYNLIYFSGEEYERMASLKITPKPDSMLRVFMLFKPLDAPIKVKPQEIRPFTRTGFTVVEWGGRQEGGAE